MDRDWAFVAELIQRTPLLLPLYVIFYLLPPLVAGVILRVLEHRFGRLAK